MSLADVPVPGETGPSGAKTTALETPSKPVSRYLIEEEIADEDDKTYVVSDGEISDESEEDSGFDSDLEVTSEPELLSDSLDENIALVDESYIALKEEEKRGNKEVNTEKSQSPKTVLEFLLKHEIPRKVFHSFQGIVTIYLYTCGFLQYQIAWPLWGLFIGTFLFELIRLNVPAVNEAVLPWVKYFIRPLERNLWNGIVFYLAGVSLVLTFPYKDVGVICILLLSWADTAASTVGRAWGKYTPKVARGKSLAGSLASFSVGVLVSYLYYGYLVPNYNVDSPGVNGWTADSSIINLHVLAFATGLIASVSEAVDVGGIDDNFTIPVFSSIFLSGLLRVSRV